MESFVNLIKNRFAMESGCEYTDEDWKSKKIDSHRVFFGPNLARLILHGKYAKVENPTFDFRGRTKRREGISWRNDLIV